MHLKPGALGHGDTEERNAASSVSLVQPESQSGVVQQVVSLPSIYCMYICEPSGLQLLSPIVFKGIVHPNRQLFFACLLLLNLSCCLVSDCRYVILKMLL